MTHSDADLGYHVFSKSETAEYEQYMNAFIDAESKQDPNSWWFAQIGLCGVYSRPSDTREIAMNRQECFGFNNQYNPSIGTDGRFCQCYKPETNKGLKTVKISDIAQPPNNKNRIQNENEEG